MAPSHADIPEEVRKADDEFWEGHERTRLQRVSQPCCTLSGIVSQLARMPGRFAVVVHGEKDCLNSFRSFQSPLSSRLFCTRVTEQDCIAGRTAERLERCIEAVVRDRKPELVVVLGTCLIELLGEDVAATVERTARRVAAPVLHLKTSGLRCSGEQAMLDMIWSVLAGWSVARRRRSRRARGAKGGEVFVFGLPSSMGLGDEPRRVLASSGLRLLDGFPGSADLDDWGRLAAAPAVFVVDRSAYPLLTRRLEEGGIDVIEVPLPVGLGPTQAFFEAVAGRFGKAEEARKALAPRVAAVRRAQAAFRKEFGVRRVAYAMRMGAYYEADRLAYGGLGDLEFFTELGFRPTLLVQGAEDDESRAFHAGSLARLGRREPFLMFPDPFLLLRLLRKKRFDLGYFSSNAFRDDERPGMPFVETRSLRPFLDGVLGNIERVRRALRGET